MGREPAWREPAAQSLLSTLMAAPGLSEPTVAKILNGLGSDTAALAELSALLGHDRSAAPATRASATDRSLAVGHALAHVLSAHPPKLVSDVRRRLVEARQWGLLSGEWLGLLAQTRDAPALYRDYRRDVLNAWQEDVPKRFRSFIARTLAAALPPMQRAIHCLQWLANGEMESFHKEDLVPCLAWANEAISLDPKHLQPEADLLSKLAQDTHVLLNPDRPQLRRAIEQAGSVQTSLAELPLDRLGAWLVLLNAGDYDLFLSQFLLAALAKASSARQHGEVLAASFQPAFAKDFTKRYSAIFSAVEPNLAVIETALGYWFLPETASKRLPAAERESLHTKITESLVAALSRLDGSTLDPCLCVCRLSLG